MEATAIEGKYQALYEYSKSLMKRYPVRLGDELRQFVLDRVVWRLLALDIPVAVGSLDGIHLHVLLQCSKRNPRIALGIAKQYATAQLKAHGFAVGLGLREGDGIWQKGSHPEPITCSRHYSRTLGYIADHRDKGAMIWSASDQFVVPELELLLD